MLLVISCCIQLLYKMPAVLLMAPCSFVYLCLFCEQHHFDVASLEEERKVAFFVPKVALVDQQLRQFMKYMDPTIRCRGLSGEQDIKDSLAHVVSVNDVLVLTPQMLLNALNTNVIPSLSCFTLLIFDECHWVRKGDPYNAIMSGFYVDQKLDGNPAAAKLPQVFGRDDCLLTYSAST